jgi:hypothetical protein
MANDDVRPNVCVREHLRRILNQHMTATEAALTAGVQEVAVEVQRQENDPRDTPRACDQAALAMCARPHAAGCASMTIFDPKTGQTVTIKPKLRTRT